MRTSRPASSASADGRANRSAADAAAAGRELGRRRVRRRRLGLATDALWLLHELEAPADDERIRRAIDLVDDRVRWEERNGGRPYFQGETEACVNGRVLTLGSRFGHADAVLAERLLGEQLADGGWNCDAPASSRTSFHSTICVLEGLLAFERATGADTSAARHRGEEYLLERGLLRSASTGRVLDRAWLVPHVPSSWCYDVLRGLDHLREAGVEPGARIAEAVDALQRARRSDGMWTATPYPGRPVLELEPAGGSSALTTARALRVLVWAGA